MTSQPIRVALVTNWAEQCGVATYAENLISYSADDVEYEIVPYSSGGICTECDIVHINLYAPIARGFPFAQFISSVGKPVLVTNQVVNVPEPWFNLADIIAVHRPPQHYYHPGIRIIPHGIPEKHFEFKNATSLILCHAGFPFAWKNHHKICEAANELCLAGEHPSILLFMPHARTDPTTVINACMKIINPAIPITIIKDWLVEDKLILWMHNEASVMVWYTSDSNTDSSQGPSGSVGMAVASRRPVVVNGNASQYSDILGYDRICPVYRDEDLASTILQAHRRGGFAEGLLRDRSYYKTCLLYRDLYLELLAKHRIR